VSYADRVAVKVWPDTRGFDRDVRKVTDKRRQTIIQAVLNDEAARRDLDALKARGGGVDLDVRIDKAKARLQELNQQIKADTDQTVQINADIRQARTRLAQLRADLAETSDDAAKVAIKADISQALASVKRLQANLAEVRSHKVEVQAETKKAREELAKLDKDRKIVVQAEADTLNARRELIMLARRRVAEIWVKVNTSSAMAQIKTVLAGLSGATMLKNWGNSFTSMLSSLPQLTLKLATVGIAIAGVASLALSALASIGPFVAGLAQIAPLALYAGPALGGLAATIGVLVMAFKGLDTTASPAAQRFNTALAGVKQQLSGIQTAVQQAFFSSGFTTEFQRLAGAVIPQLRTGLAGVAAEMGLIGAETMGGLTEVLEGGALTGFLDNLKAGLDNSALGVANLVAGITRIGLEGSKVFPDVGDWVSRIGESFLTWVNGADIEGMLRNAAEQAGFLVSGLKDLGSTVGAVFKAMSNGGGGLEQFAATMATIRAAVESPTFQVAMTTIFAGAARGAQELAGAIGPVGASLAQLAPLIAQILSTSGTALASMLTGVAAALAQPAAQNGIQAALTGIAGLATSIPWGPLGESIGLIGQAIGLLAPLVTSLLQAIVPLLPPLLSAILTLLPPLVQIVQAVLPALVQIISAAIPVIAALAPVLAALAPMFSKLADLAVAILVPALSAIGDIITNVVVPLVRYLADQIGSMADLVTAIINGDWAGAWTAFQAIAQRAGDGLNALIGWLVSAVIGQITSWASDMASKASAMWNNLLTAALTGVAKIAAEAMTMGPKLLAILGAAANILTAPGRAIIDGFLAGLKDSFAKVQSFVMGIGDWIAAHKGPINYDRRLLVPAAKAIMGGFGSTLASEFRDVEGLVAGFAPTISTTVNGTAGDASASGVAGGTSVTVNVESMTVRSDSDIRRIAQGVADLTDAKSRASGNLALEVSG